MHRIEYIGSIVALVGCLITCLDISAEKGETYETNILLGDLLATISSVFAAIYINGSDKLKEKLSILEQGTILTFIASLVPILIFPIVFSEWQYSCDSSIGVFGWLNPSNFLYTSIVMALISGCGTFILYVLCL